MDPNLVPACRSTLVREASIGRLSVPELNERVDRLRAETTYADLEQIFAGLADPPPSLRLRASRTRGTATFDSPVVMTIGGAVLVFTVWFMIAVHSLLSTAVGLAILAATGSWIAVTYRKAHPRDRR